MRSTSTPAAWSSSAPIRLTYLEEQACLRAGVRPGALFGQRFELEFPLDDRGAKPHPGSPLSAAVPGALWPRMWQGHALALGTPVTLQLLDPAIAEDPALLEAFSLEARAASAIDHPHVARILEYGVDEGLDPALPYLVLERLSGETLAARLAAEPLLPAAELVRIFAEVARGLEALHGWGVLHRYLDPAHVFLVRGESGARVKLLCSIEERFRDNLRLVRHLSQQLEGSVFGARRGRAAWNTPGERGELEIAEYQSPEQLLGQASVDERSDLWSLAVIAFEALTGTPAFSGSSLGDRLVRICNGEPNAPPADLALPSAFTAWFQRGVCKEPGERFASAREMADALARALEA